jgi:CheY-like chemotaxis protein
MARILVADDEREIRALVARALVEIGHDVVTAPDGGAALDALGQAGSPFDLLLADIKMPVMDGIALALSAARDHPGVAIVLMTGYADQRERAHGLDSLIHDVIAKPLSVAGIRQAVTQALESARR